MDENTARPKRPFFLATYNGEEKGYVSSDHVVSISPVKDYPHYTELRTDGGGAYSHTVHVRASFAKVTKLFADHGYEFVELDEVPRVVPVETQTQQQKKGGFLSRILP